MTQQAIWGAIIVALGYGSMYAATTISSYTLLCVGGLVAGQGSSWLYSAGLYPSTKNFSPVHRGKVKISLVNSFKHETCLNNLRK